MTDMTAEQAIHILADAACAFDGDVDGAYRCRDLALSELASLRQALTAPRVPEGLTERETSLVEFALRRALNAAYSMANESAQKTSAGIYREGATVKLLNDAKDIESILAKLRDAAPAPADSELARLRERVKELEEQWSVVFDGHAVMQEMEAQGQYAHPPLICATLDAVAKIGRERTARLRDGGDV